VTAFDESLFQELTTIGISAFADVVTFPVGELPATPPPRYLTFEEVSSRHPVHLDGGSGVAEYRFQLNAWAVKYSDCRAIREKIRERFNGLNRADIGAATLTRLRACRIDSTGHDFSSPIDGSKSGRHRIRIDILFWLTETVTPV